MQHIDMRGYLSFLILWSLNKKNLSGVEIALEIAQRKGTKPSPGTIYPALKELKEKKLIRSDKEKVYSLTKKGRKELISACGFFCRAFFCNLAGS